MVQTTSTLIGPQCPQQMRSVCDRQLKPEDSNNKALFMRVSLQQYCTPSGRDAGCLTAKLELRAICLPHYCVELAWHCDARGAVAEDAGCFCV
jgi:hypothetical protein